MSAAGGPLSRRLRTTSTSGAVPALPSG